MSKPTTKINQFAKQSSASRGTASMHQPLVPANNQSKPSSSQHPNWLAAGSGVVSKNCTYDSLKFLYTNADQFLSLGISLLRSSVMCIRGSWSGFKHPFANWFIFVVGLLTYGPGIYMSNMGINCCSFCKARDFHGLRVNIDGDSCHIKID